MVTLFQVPIFHLLGDSTIRFSLAGLAPFYRRCSHHVGRGWAWSCPGAERLSEGDSLSADPRGWRGQVEDMFVECGIFCCWTDYFLMLRWHRWWSSISLICCKGKFLKVSPCVSNGDVSMFDFQKKRMSFAYRFLAIYFWQN